MNYKHNAEAAFLMDLRRGEHHAIKAVYEQAYPICSNLIIYNQGTKEDSKDIFQEALLVFIQKLKEPNFQLTASVKTYIYAIVRNLWLKQLRNQGKKGLLLVIDEPEDAFQLPFDETDTGVEDKIENELRHKMIEDAIMQISEDCRKVIMSYYFHKMSLKEIAEMLDYTDSFVKVKKKRCMDALKEKVFKEPGKLKINE
jgi:RNA polymerase sigma factor (sigma-70 family)